MKTLQYFVVFATAITLGACATSPTSPPVVDGAAGAPIAREPTAADIDPDNTPDTRTQAPRPTAATASLLAAAETATAQQNHSDAISYLERAVRIAPRDPQLWIELSSAHLANNNTTAANQHARKAIALAGNNAAMTRLAWLQLADVREAEGNLTEARAIRRQYRSGRG